MRQLANLGNIDADQRAVDDKSASTKRGAPEPGYQPSSYALVHLVGTTEFGPVASGNSCLRPLRQVDVPLRSITRAAHIGVEREPGELQ